MGSLFISFIILAFYMILMWQAHLCEDHGKRESCESGPYAWLAEEKP